jgi:hypothetical protein
MGGAAALFRKIRQKNSFVCCAQRLCISAARGALCTTRGKSCENRSVFGGARWQSAHPRER